MADDGQKYLPISDALGRDIDSGKAADRDLSDFLPDDFAQELYDSSHPGPVHAENLIPISPAEGAAMRQIDPASGKLPMFPATRRVIPAPFKRDRVTGGSHGKAWTLVLAPKILPGDIITGIGLVVSVQEKVQHAKLGDFTTTAALSGGHFTGEDDVATGTEYEVTGAGGNVETYPSSAEVKVFRSRTT